MMSDFWRLVITPPAHGAWNMAVDEAILEAVGRGEVPPTLRLYAWTPPCLSLGYAQPWEEVDLANLEREGWEVVRRPTGGRAILHTDELTYAVIGPLTEPRLAGSVLESYQRLAQALVEALHLLGLPAQITDKSNAQAPNSNPVCFEVPAVHEITVAGKKIIGSAQARRREGVLQHGSLPLYGDLTRIIRALRFPDELARQAAAERLRQRAMTLEEALGHRVEWEEAAKAFRQAFERVLALELRPAGLTSAEAHRAEALMSEKYAHPSWLRRVA